MEEQPAAGFSLKNKKTIIGLVAMVFLLISIPVAVFLAQQKQVFKPKASEIAPISGPEESFTLMGPYATQVGTSLRVLVAVKSDIDAANLFAAKLKFPVDLLQVSFIETEATNAGFISNWVEKTFNNQTGEVSLVGGVPNPGYQTDPNNPPSTMVTIDFKTLKEGTGAIAFDADSAIYRNSDNVNVLDVKRELSFKIVSEVPPPITPIPSSKPCTPRPGCLDTVPACKMPEPSEGWCPSNITPTPTPIGIKGDINNDGKITLVDMSALLSNWGKTGAEAGKADINGDGVINSIDYSMMINILIENKVIKTAAEAPTF